ncbi:MAG: hypothetical protein ACRYFS_12060 [Janthinobacterium lividum]
MKLYAKQSKDSYLISTDGDPKTPAGIGILVNTEAKTVQRVPSIQKLMKQGRWEPITNGDPSLDRLVQMVPALRRYRGIEIRLASGITAWIRWRNWSSDNAAAQALLMETTGPLTMPKFELDGDYYLASQAVALLGGQVLDAPRTVLTVTDDAY